jgi:predicted HicB family RNase H-like nuclease
MLESNPMFEHKGYQGAIVSVDTDAGLFHGCVVGIQDVVTFEGKMVPELVKAFKDSVDDYLEFCEQRKEAPEKPFSGKFVMRLSPELHRLASEAAAEEQVSLNGWMVSAVETRLNKGGANPTTLSFEELDQVANCVAAILAEKKRQPVASGRKRAGSSPKAKHQAAPSGGYRRKIPI